MTIMPSDVLSMMALVRASFCKACFVTRVSSSVRSCTVRSIVSRLRALVSNIHMTRAVMNNATAAAFQAWAAMESSCAPVECTVTRQSRPPT